MTTLKSRPATLPDNLLAAVCNLVVVQADMLRVIRELREQGDLLGDEAARVVIECAALDFAQYPPLIESIRDSIERHAP